MTLTRRKFLTSAAAAAGVIILPISGRAGQAAAAPRVAIIGEYLGVEFILTPSPVRWTLRYDLEHLAYVLTGGVIVPKKGWEESWANWYYYECTELLPAVTARVPSQAEIAKVQEEIRTKLRAALPDVEWRVLACSAPANSGVMQWHD